MLLDSHTVGTYSNDGFPQCGVGNYVVQSFSINGKQRPLPKMSIFTKSKTSLKEMQLMTFKMLAASTGWKYTEKELVEKINFVMTDSTSHNLGATEEVCAKLQTDSLPDSLVCHIHPMMMFQRKIKAVWQDHCFNRVFDCCIKILYHLDVIKLYLDKYSNISNGVAILDRPFLNMKVLKPIFCSKALIGIHFTRPYLALLLDTTTTYETLLTAFPIVYDNLADNVSEKLIQTDEKVVNFTDDKRFKSTLPKKCLHECVSRCASEYKKEILQLLKIIPPHLAACFTEERDALFGFGPKAHENTGILLKISSVTDEEK